MLNEKPATAFSQEVRPVQFFEDDYLSFCRTLPVEEVAEFLEDFRERVVQLADLNAATLSR